jgi:adenylate kinase
MPAKAIIFIGPQGSGKGTQAKILVEKFGAVLIETGGLLREITKEDSEFGRYIKGLLDSGTLVSDKDIEVLVNTKLEAIDPERIIIFDGIPRTLAQAEYLVGELHKLGREEIHVLNVALSREESLKRLSLRRVCENCKTPAIFNGDPGQVCANCGGKLVVRNDDTPESINWRLDQYEKDTLPVLEYMKENSNIHFIDGAQSIEKVSEDINKALNV